MAFRPDPAAVHQPVAVSRRPALDRPARRGAHGVGSVAAHPLAALVVGPAAGLRTDPPRGQRGGPGPFLLGLAVGWFVGALVVLVVGTPALEVPLDGAVWALGRRGFVINSLEVLRPAGHGPLELAATDSSGQRAVVELYGPNQRSGGALRQIRRWLVLQGQGSRSAGHLLAPGRGTPCPDDDRRRRPRPGQHPDACRSPTRTGWTVFAHTEARGISIDNTSDEGLATPIWRSLATLQRNQISHGDMRLDEITIDGDTALFGGFGNPNTVPPRSNSNPTSRLCWSPPPRASAPPMRYLPPSTPSAPTPCWPPPGG